MGRIYKCNFKNIKMFQFLFLMWILVFNAAICSSTTTTGILSQSSSSLTVPTTAGTIITTTTVTTTKPASTAVRVGTTSDIQNTTPVRQNGSTISSLSDVKTKDTLLFGYPLTTSYIIIGGGATIVFLLFVITCLVCYNCGKSKTSKVEPLNRRLPNQIVRIPPEFMLTSRDPPPYYQPELMSNDEAGSPSVFMETKQNSQHPHYMFVYRPFENDQMLRSYSEAGV